MFFDLRLLALTVCRRLQPVNRLIDGFQAVAMVLNHPSDVLGLGLEEAGGFLKCDLSLRKLFQNLKSVIGHGVQT